MDMEQFAGNQVPLLVIGTKADQAENMRGKSSTSSVAEDFGAEQFHLVCTCTCSVWFVNIWVQANELLQCLFAYNKHLYRETSIMSVSFQVASLIFYFNVHQIRECFFRLTFLFKSSHIRLAVELHLYCLVVSTARLELKLT